MSWLMSWFKKRTAPRLVIKIDAHSISEEHLFIDTMQCPHCSKGPLEREVHLFPCTWIVRCESCHQSLQFVSNPRLIMTEEYLRVLNTEAPRTVRRYQRRYNHTNEPSRIIDLTRWLRIASYSLHQMSKFSQKGERQSADYLYAEFGAVQCLQEALKFYDPNEEFPPRSAFFSEDTYADYQSDRSAFSQQVLRSILGQQRPLAEIENDLERIEEQPESQD